MTEPYEELSQIAQVMGQLEARSREKEIQRPLERLLQAAVDVGKAWSGSWQGYHANVYYKDLQPPPPGAQFRGEWSKRLDSGDWVEFDTETVIAAIVKYAEYPDLQPARTLNGEASGAFELARLTLLSILDLAIGSSGPSFLSELRDKTNELSLFGKSDLVQSWMSNPSLSSLIMDSRNLLQKPQTPPHYWVLGEIQAIQHTLNMVHELATLARQVASHIERQARQRQSLQGTGTRVFIGHGHSQAWRALKDFLADRLSLLVDEFNRVSPVGIPTSGRLSAMLDTAAIAFLIMTGEDEQSYGELRARENVVHEAGLFQGRLGFERAIILLEDGCQEFSNIMGLGQIRFPKGNIEAAFEEIRKVLEREGVLGGGAAP